MSLLLTILFFLIPRTGSASEENDLSRVSLQLKWRHQFQFAGYYAAKDKGFYEEEGLHVEFTEGDLRHAPLEQVLAGHSDFGVSDTDILLARLRGEPVVACLTIFQHSPYVLISKKESRISSPSDLIDRKLMTSGDQGAAQLHALLQREGLPLDRIEFLPHSWNLKDLADGKVDVISGYSTAEPFQLRKMGFDASMIKVSDYGVDFYADTLFTTGKFVKNNRPEVEAMMRATARGWEYAMANPGEMIDYILTLPGVAERGIERSNLEFEAKHMISLILPDLVEIGHMNPGRWEKIAEAYQQAGIVEPMNNSQWLEGFIFENSVHQLNAQKWVSVALCLLIGGLAALVWNILLRRKVEKRTQELRRGERKLQAILDNSNNVLALLTPQGKLVELNKKALEFSGVERSDALGAHFSKAPLWRNSPDLLAKITDGFQQIIKGGNGIRMETEHTSPEGIAKTLDFSLRSLTGVDQSLEYIVAEGIDITEQKAAAIDLEASRSSLSSLVEHTRGLIWSVDQEGRLLDSNRQFRQALWRRSGNSIQNGDSVFDFFNEKECHEWKRHFERALEGDRFTSEVVITDPTGAQVHEVSLHSMVKDGKISGVTVFEFDISERKRSAEALQQSAELNQLLLDSALDAVVGVDSQGEIVHWNQQAIEVFGFSGNDAIGKPVEEIFPELNDYFANNSSDSSSLRFEMNAYRNDRSTFPAEVSLSILPKGRQVALNLFVRDITNHRKLEEKLRQSQKMEAIGQLAGGVAHDFNNLLTVIQGNASLVKDECSHESPCQPAISEIISASERAASLTGQLLAFSRQQPMLSKVFGVNKCAEGVSRMLERLIGEDIRLVTKLCDISADVHADEGMLEQVILNLAVNGRDAMPQGGLLTMETRVVELAANSAELPASVDPGEFVQIIIKDTGKGIPAENLPHIFEPFFTTKEVGKGTGLGLATVFGIVEQHKGWIDVKSKVDKGTIFTVWLPRVVEAAVETTGKYLPKNGDKRAKSGTETILLVEDEEMLRMIARKILTKHGYEVLEAHNGRHALGVWEQFGAKVDLLLTDIVMPEGLSGHELATRLQAEKSNLKVIYSSGYSAEIFRGDAVFPDDASFVGKPYLPEALLSEIRNVLDGAVLTA
ncbi:MAG: ABC transporter substrate-binding protein [Verrucomicrobiales bacterium]|nr:ABC transporter substrate-binding protein [Verrucomicrobiales bacterium]